MPIVGMRSDSVIFAASGAGMPSMHDGERARGLQGLGVVQQPLAVLAAALHPEPAERVHRLRGEPEVAHHGDARRGQLLDLVRDPLPPSSLTACAPASFMNRTAACSASVGDAW